MKKSIIILLVVSLIFTIIFTGCSSNDESETGNQENQDEVLESESNNESQSDETKKPLEGEHLVVAMSANYKYFETVTVDEDGNEIYEGLDIDILEKLSENLGFTYEINNMPFASLIGSLQSNQADFVISGMSYTEERDESIDFSDKYASAKVGVLVKKESSITSVKDLEGKKVACSAGTNFENIIKKINGAQLVTFDGQAAVTQELVMDRVDAAVTGGTAVKNIVQENDDLTFFIISDDEIDLGSLSTYNIGFPSGSDLVPIFNEEIANLKEDGTLDSLITEWLGEDYVD